MIPVGESCAQRGRWRASMALMIDLRGIRWNELLQLDDDVAGGIELCTGSGRDEAGGVVFLNNERADAARRIEVRTSQHRGVDPAVLLAEIGLAGILLGRFRPARRYARRHLAASAQARADQLDRH